MDIKSLAEALYLFNKIETLLHKKGAQGESFSDLVKSFDPYLNDNIEKCQKFIRENGYKFYFNRADETYYIKDDFINTIDNTILLRYRNCKKNLANYYCNSEKLLDGFYRNLRIIGHERNQLLHQYNYSIKNFKLFKKACYQIIRYLEKGKSIPKNKIINLKEVEYVPINSSYEYRFPYKMATLFIAVIFGIFATTYNSNEIYFCNSCKEFILLGFIALLAIVIVSISSHLIKQFLSKLFFNRLIPILLFSGMVLFFISHKNSNIQITDPHKIRCDSYYVIPHSLNIRAKPTSKSKKIGVLRFNQKICISQRKQKWFYIHNKGWVFSKYLSKRILKGTSKNF